MRIGIIGVGNIGSTLTQRLSERGHDVKVANSRGPHTIPAELLTAGARAVEATDVVTDVDALIISVPLARVPELRPIVDRLPDDAVVLDTSNYYPARDGRIAAIDEGQVESLWVAVQLGGRRVVKAWNAILSSSFRSHASAPGDPDRIAVPVAADRDEDRALGTALVEDTGFEGLDAGTLADSWRQQPGTPAYCTDLTGPELRAALAAAVPGRGPRRRDLAMTVLTELMDDGAERGDDFFVQANRLLYS